MADLKVVCLHEDATESRQYSKGALREDMKVLHSLQAGSTLVEVEVGDNNMKFSLGTIGHA